MITPPTDAELNTYIKARLGQIGIDLEQLNLSTTNTATGSPSQTSVLSSLRSFIRGSATTISNWTPPPAPGVGPAEALQQQSTPPALYPIPTLTAAEEVL